MKLNKAFMSYTVLSRNCFNFAPVIIRCEPTMQDLLNYMHRD